MSNKVRIGHEDIFIKHITDALNIPKKYYFDYNHRRVSNHNETKRVAVRKFKAYPMNISALIEFIVNDANGTPVNTVISFSLIGYQPISGLLNCITKFINDIVIPSICSWMLANESFQPLITLLKSGIFILLNSFCIESDFRI
jgi:hypothetical protein